MRRAYAVLHVKADKESRTISGIASTPEPDRAGDIFEPLGATFDNPLPLLFHHDRRQPVGTAMLAASPEGITFTATLPEIAATGTLRDRVEDAWQSIVAGLMRGVSIGFRPMDDGMKFLKTGGIHFLKTEIVELSLVTIPQNADASVLTIKSFDDSHLAALGRHTSGDSDRPVVSIDKGARTMKQTIAEQITNNANTRAAKVARMGAIMEAAGDNGTTLNDTDREEYDGLTLEVKSLDDHLTRLRDLEKAQQLALTPVVSPVVMPVVTPRTPVIQVKSNLPPGTGFTRIAMALATKRGNWSEAAEYAKRWDDTTPEVALYLKAAVAAGNTTDTVWAGPLAQYQNIASEFLELLRPATILGKIPGLRRVPFLASVPTQTAGGSYGWVGQGAPKAVTKLGFGTAKLDISKAAGIIVLTEELVRTSSPSAEAIVRADMIAGIAAFLDMQFIDPSVAAVVNVNPASITNGLTPIASTDDPLADLYALFAALSTANVPLAGVTMIMSETNALGMGMLRDAQGNRIFPNMSPTGGTAEGITIVTSNAANGNVIALQPSAILYADDGGVQIDVSREASVQMDSAPTNPPDATTVLVSLWQNNLVGLRAERWINWKRGRDVAVQIVTGAAYAPAPAAALAARRAPTGTAARPVSPPPPR